MSRSMMRVGIKYSAAHSCSAEGSASDQQHKQAILDNYQRH